MISLYQVIVQSYLFGAPKLKLNAIKRNFIYNVFGVAFDRAGYCWSVSNLFAQNVMSFNIQNSLLRYSKNLITYFLILIDAPADANSDNVDESGKNY